MSINKISRRSTLLLSSFVIILAELLAVASPAFAVTGQMSLLPSSQNLAVGSNVNIAVREDSGTDTVNVAQVKLDYPNTKLQFVGIDYTGSPFDTNISQNVTSGQIDFVRGDLGTATSGSQLIATITFKALSAGSAGLTFGCLFDANSCSDGNAVVRSTDQANVINSTTGSTITVTGVGSGPASVSWASGRIDVFVRGSDNMLWHRYFAGSWSNWESLGGVLASNPTVTSWGPGRLDVFAKGNDGQMWHMWYENGWSRWEALGGALASAPAATTWSPGRLDVFVRGTDNQLWHRWYTNGWSPGWENLGGGLSSNPAVASWSVGRLDVFVRGTDNQLWHRWFSNGGWSPGYEGLGGTLATGPAAVSWAQNRIDVFSEATDSSLQQSSYNGSWTGWSSLGGTLTSTPSVSTQGSGKLDVFAGATDSSLQQSSYNGSWSGWTSLGGVLSSNP
ncbi:MAG TPA: cohesin domain-containing protein [Candidatus Saccharimonadia bacterium]|nr:cohesin domain-containing protein [Candidatus Saccharimonadia bacterium]